MGTIVFSPLAQGLLTESYLNGVPEDSRASREGSLSRSMLSERNLERVRALKAIAAERGQSLAQLALAWTLRDGRVTSTLIGASSVEQLDQNLQAVQQLEFSPDELEEIDRHAQDSDINLWAASSAYRVATRRGLEHLAASTLAVAPPCDAVAAGVSVSRCGELVQTLLVTG